MFKFKALFRLLAISLVLTVLTPLQATALPDNVSNYAKITQPNGNTFGRFGSSAASIGDIDGNGVRDFVVGAPNPRLNIFTTFKGAVYTILMNPDLTVMSTNLIYDPNLPYSLSDGGEFGFDVESLGDLDGDGNPEVAVGEPEAFNLTDSSVRGGLVHILFLDSDGTVKSAQRIGDGVGGLTAALEERDDFGAGLANLGDINGDGLTELSVSAPGRGSYPAQGSGSLARNASGNVFVLSLTTTGEVASQTVIEPNDANINIRNYESRYGTSVSSAGDRDGDSVNDLFVGTYYRIPRNSSGSSNVLPSGFDVLYLNADGSVKGRRRHTNYNTAWVSGRRLGGSGLATSITSIPDQNGDGLDEVMVNNPGYNGPDSSYPDDIGAAIVLPLDASENIISSDVQIISGQTPGFTSVLNEYDNGGYGLNYLGDYLNNGKEFITFGAPLDDTTGSNRGAFYLLEFTPPLSVQFAAPEATVAETAGQVTVNLLVSGPDTTGSGDQTVELALTNGADYAYFTDFSQPLTLTVPEGDYRTPQTIPVTLGILDDDRNYDSVDEVISFRLQNPTGSLSANSSARFTLRLSDDDVNGLTVTPPASLQITETDTTGEFALSLSAEPPFAVTVDVTNDNSQKYTLDTETVEFNPTNWDTPQIVSVTPIADADFDEETGTVTFAMRTYGEEIEFLEAQRPFADSPSSYRGGYTQTRTVTILDPEPFDFVLTPSTQTITEDEEVATYSVRGLQAPAEEVVVNLQLDDPTRATLSTDSLTLTPTNWDTGVEFTLTSIPNFDLSEPTLTITASTTDATNTAQLVIINTTREDDGDGVESAVEDTVYNGGDGNNDGVLDSTQPDVAGFRTINDQSLVLDANECNFEEVTRISEVDLPLVDEDYDYPNGLVRFVAECPEVTLDVYTDVAEGVLRQFVDEYADLPGVEVSELVIDSRPIRRFTFTLSDGGLLDAGPAGDGRITGTFGFGALAAEPVTDNQTEDEAQGNQPGPELLIRTGGSEY